LLAMLICYFFEKGDAAKVAGFICGIIMINHSVEPWQYARLRCIETMLGVAVAWGISYVPKLSPVDETAPK
jgi:hypothetical protein